jgi:hypothetical protein
MEDLSVQAGFQFFSNSLDVLMNEGITFQMNGEEMTKEGLMQHAWGEYNPSSGAPKKSKKVKKVKKPRPLTGYTYFGKQNRIKFNKEMEKLDDKPKFVTYVGKKWKGLNKDEQSEWNDKAKAAFEESNSTNEESNSTNEESNSTNEESNSTNEESNSNSE